MRYCESSVFTWWCRSSPRFPSSRPGAPEMTTTGDFSANAPAIGFTMLSAPAPQVTAATDGAQFHRAAASAAKPTAGSWLSV